MTREEAASKLGVPADASPEAVRRAWRTWARLAHPDVGGDHEHFRTLVIARDVLLDGSRPAPIPMPEPGPRTPFRDVVAMPGVARCTGIGALAVAAGVAGLLGLVLPIWLAGLVMGFLGTVAAVAVARSMLTARADVGHRIWALVLAWSPIAAVQIALAQVAGASVLTALPALALPVAGAVSLVNPGAGLWRPAPH